MIGRTFGKVQIHKNKLEPFDNTLDNVSSFHIIEMNQDKFELRFQEGHNNLLLFFEVGNAKK